MASFQTAIPAVNIGSPGVVFDIVDRYGKSFAVPSPADARHAADCTAKAKAGIHAGLCFEYPIRDGARILVFACRGNRPKRYS